MSRRVLLVIAQLEVGGAEVQFVRLAARLAAHGFVPEAAVFYPGGALEPDLRRAGVRVHHVRRTSRAGGETILDLARVLGEGGHTIVHSFLWPANWRARIAGVLASTPIRIASPRSVETWMRRPHVALDRQLARWTDAIIVNSTAVRGYLVERERLSPDIFHVVPNGLDPRFFAGMPDGGEARARLGLPAGAPVVLSVGNLEPEKNHEDFLRMAARLRSRIPDARFLVVGGGERREPLQRAARELGLEEALTLVGFRRDVRPYLSACDVFFNTSAREGCCNAILEAMAAGKPVVAYAVGGNPELVADGRTGRLVSFGDVEHLASAAGEYLEDPRLAARHGEAGRRRVEEDFTVERMVSRTVDLYRELMQRKGLPE